MCPMPGKDGSICGHLFSLKPSHGTSKLSRHLQHKHKEHHFEWSTASTKSKYNQEKRVAAAAKVTGTQVQYNQCCL